MSTTKFAAVIISATLFTMPVCAGDRGGGPNWGTVVGAGILGGILGSATAPAPTPQQIIIVVPPQPAYAAPQPARRISDREILEHYVPEPTYVSPPPSQRIWWCRSSQRWYPDVTVCPVPWSH